MERRLMKDYRASIEKLRTEAAEAALIRDLATDRAKTRRLRRVADHLNRLADEVERAMRDSARPSQLDRDREHINQRSDSI
jgi:hypothetical protein